MQEGITIWVTVKVEDSIRNGTAIHGRIPMLLKSFDLEYLTQKERDFLGLKFSKNHN